MSSTTIALPAGNDSTLNLLATAVNGNSAESNLYRHLYRWHQLELHAKRERLVHPAELCGRIAGPDHGLPHRTVRSHQHWTFYLYGYSFAINSTKTVKSITLPNNRNVVVLAIDYTPAAAGPPPAASPTLSPPPGTYTSAQSVTLSDSTPGALIYYTTNGTTPTMSSSLYSPGTPLQISSTTTVEAIAVASGYSNSAVTSGTYTISSPGTPDQRQSLRRR